jgi:hypothetical protein
MVDLLAKRHATFLMEACRRHRDEGACWFGRGSGLAILDAPLSYGAAI